MEVFWSNDEISAAFKKHRSLRLDWPTVDVMEVDGADINWHRGLNDKAFNNFCVNQSLKSMRIYFLRTARTVTQKGEIRHDFLNPVTAETLQNFTRPSRAFLSRVAQATKWTVLGATKRLLTDDQGGSKGFSSCYEYGWVSQELGTGPSLIDCRIESGHTTYHCVNYPVSAIDRYISLLEDIPLLASKYWLVDRLATDACLDAIRQGTSVGHSVLKTYEQDLETKDFESATNRIHQLSKSFGTLRTNAIELASTLIHLQECENAFEDTSQSSISPPACHDDRICDISLQISSCQTMLRWIESYERRVRVQLNLLLHRMNLQESLEHKALAMQSRNLAEQSKLIGEYMAELARQTTRDSSSMITIAAVTMFFLPATFISSLFSTGFFQFENGKVDVSKDIWIYPATVVPLTITVFVIWLAWITLKPVFGAFSGHQSSQSIRTTP